MPSKPPAERESAPALSESEILCRTTAAESGALLDEMVRLLAARHPEIRIDDKELEVLAKRWEIEHGGYSGRAAQQFIDYLAGKAKGNA